MSASLVVMTNPAPEVNSGRVASIRPLAVTTPIRRPARRGGPYPSILTVPEPTMITSARARSLSITAESFALDSSPDAPPTTVEPSIEATMHRPTHGRSSRLPSGAGVRLLDRDVLEAEVVGRGRTGSCGPDPTQPCRSDRLRTWQGSAVGRSEVGAARLRTWGMAAAPSVADIHPHRVPDLSAV